ncbi:MAG: hypothetical protein ACOCZX_00055 [Candidatus Bipolaricaulota bacterium]
MSSEPTLTVHQPSSGRYSDLFERLEEQAEEEEVSMNSLAITAIKQFLEKEEIKELLKEEASPSPDQD